MARVLLCLRRFFEPGPPKIAPLEIESLEIESPSRPFLQQIRLARCAMFFASAALALASVVPWLDAAGEWPADLPAGGHGISCPLPHATGAGNLVDYSQIVTGFHRLNWTGDPTPSSPTLRCP